MNFPLWCSSHPAVGTHVYRVINNRMKAMAFVSPLLSSPLQMCKVGGPGVFRNHIMYRLFVMLSKTKERQKWIQLNLNPILGR